MPLEESGVEYASSVLDGRPESAPTISIVSRPAAQEVSVAEFTTSSPSRVIVQRVPIPADSIIR
jgi:hypothetical protein